MRVIVAIDVRWFNACADFALTQALAMRKIGHEVLLLADPGSPPALKAAELDLALNDDIYFSSVNIVGSIIKMKRIIRDFSPDAIIAHRGESHLIGALAARGFGVPVIRFRGDVRKPRSDIFSRILNEKYTNAIAVSTENLRQAYQSVYSLNGIPVEVIYPGIDLSRFTVEKSRRDLKEQFGIPPDEIVVGIVGRLSPVKGHRYFLEAAAAALRENANIRIVIAGENAQISNGDIIKQAEGLGIDRIMTFGRISNIEKLISAFDVGVVSSIGSEMICRVLLEYYAAGVAAVGTAVNQVGEIMKLSDAGMLVPPGEPRSMAAAIVRLAAEPDLRKIHGDRGRQWMQTSGSIECLGKNTVKLLERVIHG